VRDRREVARLGDLGLRVAIDGVRDRVALREHLAGLPFVHDAVVTESHAAVYADALPADAVSRVRDVVDRLASAVAAASRTEGQREAGLLTIPVRFSGPDLAEVARQAARPEAEVIARFLAPVYDVAFLGFMPGFAYLRGVDPVLAAIPRRRSPRARVEPGSVAIAAGYAGIYPAPCPGGWNVLGLAEGFAPFADDGRVALAMGARVRFSRAP
jgi:KipI family sensor histidine kinase inhibitor